MFKLLFLLLFFYSSTNLNLQPNLYLHWINHRWVMTLSISLISSVQADDRWCHLETRGLSFIIVHSLPKILLYLKPEICRSESFQLVVEKVFSVSTSMQNLNAPINKTLFWAVTSILHIPHWMSEYIQYLQPLEYVSRN